MSHHLTAYQCHQCGLRSIMAPGYCSRCRSKKSYDFVEVEGIGTVFSCTTVSVCEEKLQNEAPYQLAVIECEGGLRLLGRIENSIVNPVKIGSNVELSEIKNGAPLFKKR